jgi:SpoVK/Ycf46/Vps4 family AAA+-type ATPase
VTSVAVSEAVRTTECPSERLAPLWAAVIVDGQIKTKLINHTLLALQLRGSFPFETTAVHGLIALVGPPGTGKTTLARGLAHQLSNVIRGEPTRLIEVTPHGLMSAEHGQSQQLVSELLEEYLPSLVEDGVKSIVLLDEVESMAVARSETSLSANPVDVHRATDAVLTAVDHLAASTPNLVFVVTSNFVKGLDEAFLSRADAVIEIPLPDAKALAAIVTNTLASMGTVYPQLGILARDPALARIAAECVGVDGRQARKLVAQALARRTATAIDAGELTIADLKAAAKDLHNEIPEERARVRAA